MQADAFSPRTVSVYIAGSSESKAHQLFIGIVLTLFVTGKNLYALQRGLALYRGDYRV